MKNQQGQAAVEYMLMVAVVAMVTISAMGKIRGYLVDNPDSILNSLTAGYVSMFGGDPSGETQLTYKRFSIRR